MSAAVYRQSLIPQPLGAEGQSYYQVGSSQPGPLQASGAGNRQLRVWEALRGHALGPPSPQVPTSPCLHPANTLGWEETLSFMPDQEK